MPTTPALSVYHCREPWGELTIETGDERLPYPWCVKVSGGAKSPLKVHGRGLYTRSTELQRWIEQRGAPAIVHISAHLTAPMRAPDAKRRPRKLWLRCGCSSRPRFPPWPSSTSPWPSRRTGTAWCVRPVQRPRWA